MKLIRLPLHAAHIILPSRRLPAAIPVEAAAARQPVHARFDRFLSFCPPGFHFPSPKTRRRHAMSPPPFAVFTALRLPHCHVFIAMTPPDMARRPTMMKT